VIWGAATAAIQIEGALDEDGRGASIWDRFPAANGDTPALACDHYHRWPEDLDLLRELGLETYRFSIAWPRVLPAGRGAVNQRGLDFYRRLVEGLLDRGVEPNATLYHWDLPQALQDAGGWASRDTAYAFAEYAAVVADALAGLVPRWATHNEPGVTTFAGHHTGEKAPGHRDLTEALRAGHHVLLSHGLALQELRRHDVYAGVVLNLSTIYGDDADAVARTDAYVNRWFLDPIFRGEYPAAFDRPDCIEDGDLELISRPIDWLGVNYYFPVRVGAVPRPPLTAMGWEVDADAFHELLLRLRREYGEVPLFVTENGAAYHDPPPADGVVEDPKRVAYLRDHIAAVERAVAHGVNLQGYYVWSLLDNFEWEHGYDKRFGIVAVDYETQRRTPKRSALWYRDLVATRRRS
jgi:beta-glucosidase